MVTNNNQRPTVIMLIERTVDDTISSGNQNMHISKKDRQYNKQHGEDINGYKYSQTCIERQGPTWLNKLGRWI